MSAGRGAKYSLINYDGINLFVNGKWSGLEVPDVAVRQELIGFLETRTDEQVEHYIRVEKFKNGTQKTWNSLKHSTK